MLQDKNKAVESAVKEDDKDSESYILDDNGRAIPFSKIETLHMTDKDLNAQYNTGATNFSSSEFNKFKTRFMPALNQYGSPLNALLGGGEGNQTFNLTDRYFTVINRYLQYLEILSESNEYKNWPDNFQFDYHDFERMLWENGTCAFIKVKDDVFLVQYKVESKNYLNKPETIKPSMPQDSTAGWKDRLFTEDKKEFVIINNNLNQMALMPRVLRWLILWEDSAFQLEKQGKLLAPKVFYNGDIDVRRAKLKNAMEKVINNDDTFQEVFLKKGNRAKAMEVGFQDNIDKLFATIQFEDRTEAYKLLIDTAKDFINESIGLATNPMMNKADRTNTLEINTQQDMSSFTKKHTFKMREEALKKVNKYFGVNIEIVETATAYDESIENTNTGNINKGQGDNDE